MDPNTLLPSCRLLRSPLPSRSFPHEDRPKKPGTQLRGQHQPNTGGSLNRCLSPPKLKSMQLRGGSISIANVGPFLIGGGTPSEYSTGEHVRQGRITRSGNWRVRNALIESSWILIGRDSWMRMIYMRLKSRKGAKRAIIAIARKLIIILRSMLLRNRPHGRVRPMVQGA